MQRIWDGGGAKQAPGFVEDRYAYAERAEVYACYLDHVTLLRVGCV